MMGAISSSREHQCRASKGSKNLSVSSESLLAAFDLGMNHAVRRRHSGDSSAGRGRANLPVPIGASRVGADYRQANERY